MLAWRPGRLLAVLLAALLPAALPAAKTIAVVMTSPEPGKPVFGVVELAADVFSETDVGLVAFYVDGEKVGEAQRPPYRVVVDVGEENLSHRFVIRAWNSAGEMAETVLESPEIRVDDQVTAELQQLYVTVDDGTRRVLDLTRESFTILDSRTPQRMVTFARGDVRLTAAILVDASASMKGRRLLFALRGAATFVLAMKPADEASIRLFSDRLLYATPFSNDSDELTAGLTRIDAAGGTALNDHLYAALKLLEHQQGRRVLILLSDGVDTHSALRMPEVAWLARRSRALIYWIRVDPASRDRFSAWKNPDQYRSEYELLERTVDETGGRIISLETIEQIEGATREVLQELREQYVLGYYPNDPANDGSWREVEVRVSRPGLRVRTRDGYIDL